MIPFHSRQWVPFLAGTMIRSATRIVFSSVGNDQCRFNDEKIHQALLTQIPTFIVKGVCRFVKKENRRIFPKDTVREIYCFCPPEKTQGLIDAWERHYVVFTDFVLVEKAYCDTIEIPETSQEG